MFERYTEKARRAIFMARYEANLFGAPQIEAEYILLGLLREDKNLIQQFIHQSNADVESIRKQIEGCAVRHDRIREQVDIPLSGEAKRTLTYAAEESEQLGTRHIGTEHLLLGLLRTEGSLPATILHDLGLRLSDLRQELTNKSIANRAVTHRLSAAASLPANRDEKWLREISDAGIDRELFTRDDLISECVQVAALRQFDPEAEALLRLLAAKGLADPQRLHTLAFELRHEKGLADFLERLH